MDHKKIAAVILLTIKQLGDLELAALNLSLEFGGTVPQTITGFDEAVKLKILKPSGSWAFDLEPLKMAFTVEVNRRVDAGSPLDARPRPRGRGGEGVSRA